MTFFLINYNFRFTPIFEPYIAYVDVNGVK